MDKVNYKFLPLSITGLLICQPVQFNISCKAVANRALKCINAKNFTGHFPGRKQYYPVLI